MTERIAAFSPEARFICLLRDPVERTISHYWHMVRHGAEYRPSPKRSGATGKFAAVSHYAMRRI